MAMTSRAWLSILAATRPDSPAPAPPVLHPGRLRRRRVGLDRQPTHPAAACRGEEGSTLTAAGSDPRQIVKVQGRCDGSCGAVFSMVINLAVGRVSGSR